ncbi:DNA polymerase IV [Spirochaetia bacterium 38H-sp]|uniref:DNA polymerase IV n=1 Tax=Rarispira pelagica TaxID=3141764 RepID=A0ABU9UBL7_9SPIR
MKKTVFFHVDLDSFYASVEKVENPSISGKPVIVGGLPPKRGVVSACSYEARAYGIKSGMPISQAYRLCPHGIFLPVRMNIYAEYSRKIMDILKDSCPEVRQISIDEASLDMSGMELITGNPEKAARDIKNKIKEITGITASIGIAANRYMAKIASDMDKPDGLVIIEEGAEKETIAKIPMEKLWGIGKSTLALLHKKGIDSTIKLQNCPLAKLISIAGNSLGKFLYSIARGEDPGIYSTYSKTKSVSNERTFDKDISTEEEVQKSLLKLSEMVMKRLIKEGETGKTVQIKIKYNDFTLTSAQISLPEPIRCTEELYHTALYLFTQKWNKISPIRLIGIGVSGVKKEKDLYQPALFMQKEDKKNKLEKAIVDLEIKKGKKIFTRARLLGKDGL